MTGAASVGGGDHLRLFCALRLPATAAAALAAWGEEAFAGAEVRFVAAAHLHVTLAFLGRRPAAELERVAAALRESARGLAAPVLAVRGYRETRSVGMLVCDDDGGRATALAEDLHARLERLGVYRREERSWLAHLTVARWRERPRLRLEPPPVRTFVPSDAAVFISRLRPGGAQYEVLESVALGG